MVDSVKLVEVAARDGLQNERIHLSPQERIQFITKLNDVGFEWIEAGSFVHPKAVPQMAGSDIIADYFAENAIEADLSYLVPNAKGLELAKAHKVKHIAIFVAASEAFSQANIRMSVQESFEKIKLVVKEALDSGIKVRGYLSTIFKGVNGEDVSANEVAKLSERLLEMGCYEVSLGDTTGVGKVKDTKNLIEELARRNLPLDRVALHYHDTFGNAIANIDQAYDMGIRIFDASTSGIGGCPFAKSATGNVDMLKVISWAKEKGAILPKINMDKLNEASSYIQGLLNKN